MTLREKLDLYVHVCVCRKKATLKVASILLAMVSEKNYLESKNLNAVLYRLGNCFLGRLLQRFSTCSKYKKVHV